MRKTLLCTLALLLLFVFAIPAISSVSEVITFKYDDFTNNNLIKLDGDTEIINDSYTEKDVIRLTPAVNGKSGTAYYQNYISLENDRSFSTYFTFRIIPDGLGADGIVFILNNDTNQLGVSGGGIGYYGMNNSIGIEFDTFDNSDWNAPSDKWYGDKDLGYNHIAINVNGNIDNPVAAASNLQIVSATGESSYNFKDGNLHHVWIDYDGPNSTIEVRINRESNERPENALISYNNLNLADILKKDEVYVGFSATTGGSRESNDINYWYFSNDIRPIDTVNKEYVSGPSINLTASPVSDTETTLTAAVTNADGSFASNEEVEFSTNLGTLSSTTATTNQNGEASVTLTNITNGGAYVKVLAAYGAYDEVIMPPSAPTLESNSATSITLTPIDGAEYKMEGGEWQASNYFSDLSMDVEYTFYARMRETPTSAASTATIGVTFSTLPPSADGLLAYWKFDNDFTANFGGVNFNLNGHGAEGVPIQGQFMGRNAVKFERDKEQYLLTENSILESGNNFTYMAWYYLTESIEGSDRYFVLESTGDYYPVSYGLLNEGDEAKGQVFASHSNSTHISTEDEVYGASVGKWYNIIVTYNNSDPYTHTAYINGEEGGTLEAEFIYDLTGLVIGSYRDQNDRFWEGYIDDVAIWNRVLTGEEINSLQTSQVSGEETYTVYYYGNGNTDGSLPIDSSIYEDGTTVTVLGNTGGLEKTGHTFAGWNTQADGNGTYYEANRTFTRGSSNVTLYAKWTMDTYTITYNLDGGTNYDGAPTSYTVETETINLGIPTKAGYTFDGWYNAATDGNELTQIVNGSSGDKTLYARWIANSDTVYQVEHYKQNIDASGYNLMEIETKGGTTDTIVTAVYKNYIGFIENTTHSDRVASGTIFDDGSLTLKLFYDRDTYTVSFNTNGGSGVSDTSDIRYEATIPSPITPTKEGYIFLGWYKEPGLTNVWSFTGDKVLTDTTLYAKWIDKETIMMTANPANVAGSKSFRQVFTLNIVNDTVTGSVYASDISLEGVLDGLDIATVDKTSPTTVTAEVYGNLDSEGIGTITLNDSKLTTSISPLTAEVAVSLYSIAYDGNGSIGGSIPNDNNRYAEEATVTVLGNTGSLEKTGYTFVGWNTERDGSGISYLEDSSLTMSTANITLYAQWKVNTYIVSFNSSGGSVVADITADYSTTITEPVDQTTKEGYIFLGWYKEAGLTNAWNFTVDKVTEDILLYAKWIDKETIMMTPNPANILGSKSFRQVFTLNIVNDTVTGSVYASDISLEGVLDGLDIATVDKTSPTTVTAEVYGNLDSEGIGTITLNDSKLTTSISPLTAEVAVTLNSIAYDGNGSIGGSIPNDNNRYAEEVTITVLGNTGSLEKTGYTFVGWNTERDGSGTSYGAGSNLTMGTTDVILYAQWSFNRYTVTFKDWDETELKTETVYHGSNATAPDNPTRSGYRFTGWDEEFTNITSDLTITAEYRRNSSNSKPEQTQVATTVYVNGQEHAAGTETVTEEDGGRSVELRADANALNEKLDEAIKENETSGSTTENKVEIPVAASNANQIKSILTGDIVKKMDQNNFTLAITTEKVDYIIPAKEIGIDQVAAILDVKADSLKDIEVEVQINKLNETQLKEIEENAKVKGHEILFPPVEFKVVAKTTTTSGEVRETTVSEFSSYVTRVMEIPTGVDPTKVSTGVVYNPDGTFSHIPTTVFEKDGKWYAKLNSLTNSSYSVIWNPTTVASVENHWSKDAVNDMASRLVIKNPETFEPNGSITRGEFAEYITKALGIYRTGVAEQGKFLDVELNNKLADAITIATEYEIITGYPDGTFRPNTEISREEAMTIYARAMDIAGLKEVDNSRIDKYKDKNQIADWAYEFVKKTVSVGVFNGKTHETIDPKGTFTYAEAAIAIRNLLTEAKLIN